MANATAILEKTLRIGVNEPLYVTAAGAVNATGTVGTAPFGTFAIPPQCSNYRGTLWLQAIPIGGTVTALTFQLEVSLDSVTWGIVSPIRNYSGATAAASAFSGIAFGTLATAAVLGLDISGLGGVGTLRLNFTTVTLGTGSGANIWAHIG